MAWDSTQPTNSTKIRNLGVVIRPNWVAIQQADATFKPYAVNLANRTLLPISADPAAIAETYIPYSKEDADGNPELFGIDESSNVVQLTQLGRMGSKVTPITISTIRFGSDTTTYTRNNFVLAYGRVNSGGATIVANNCSISRIGTGQYRVTLSPVASGTNYVPVATPNDEGNARMCKIAVNSASQFTVRVVNEDNDNRDCGMYFHVVGVS